MIKAILYCGHLSPYGLAHLTPLLESSVIQIEEVVLASYSRWQTFRATLSGLEPKEVKDGRQSFDLRISELSKQIKAKKPNCNIRISDNVNSDNEYKNGKKFDLIISCAYPQIFDVQLIISTRMTGINFHPSYLPRCRGAHPVYWTIASGEEFAGVSCHYMTAELDKGDILVRRKIPLDPAVKYNDLYQQIINETPKLIAEVETFLEQKKTPIVQEEDYTYFRNDRDIHRKVNFGRESVEVVDAKIRAGGAYAFDLKGNKIMLKSSQILDKTKFATNDVGTSLIDGTIVHSRGNLIIYNVGEKFIKSEYSPRSINKILVRIEYLLKKFGLKESMKTSIYIGERLL